MTLFAFTYANACTAMKGFDTNKNKKLEDEERSKLVYYIEVNISFVLHAILLQLYASRKDIKGFIQNISQNANVDEDFDKMIEASEIGKPDQERYFHMFA